MTQIREELLASAKDLIIGDRANEYDTKDDASKNFIRIGKLWEQVLGVEVSPEKVALCMVMVKVSRLIANPTHKDSWIDGAGYFALGGEIALTEGDVVQVEDLSKKFPNVNINYKDM